MNEHTAMGDKDVTALLARLGLDAAALASGAGDWIEVTQSRERRADRARARRGASRLRSSHGARGRSRCGLARGTCAKAR